MAVLVVVVVVVVVVVMEGVMVVVVGGGGGGVGGGCLLSPAPCPHNKVRLQGAIVARQGDEREHGAGVLWPEPPPRYHLYYIRVSVHVDFAVSDSASAAMPCPPH